jgi:hypothetical protein
MLWYGKYLKKQQLKLIYDGMECDNCSRTALQQHISV